MKPSHWSFRTLALVSATPASSYSDLHAVMRGDISGTQSSSACKSLMGRDLQEITGDPSMSFEIFEGMCKATRRQSSLN